jgi:hypothetical protein
MSFTTTSALTALHPESNGYFSFFLEDYELNQDLELSFDYFKLAFQRMPHLLANGHSRMVFNTFKTVFTLKIQRMDSLSCSNFVLISHKVTFHPKLHMSLEWPAS